MLNKYCFVFFIEFTSVSSFSSTSNSQTCQSDIFESFKAYRLAINSTIRAWFNNGSFRVPIGELIPTVASPLQCSGEFGIKGI
jgi:hypothetical protein